MTTSKLRVLGLLLVVLLVTAAAVAAGWKWRKPVPTGAGSYRIAGWTWSGEAPVQAHHHN